MDSYIEEFGNDSYDKMDGHKMHMVLVAIVIIGALNWGATAVGYNLVQLLSNLINRQFNSAVPIDKVIYWVVAISAILLALRRNTWLPFLGKTVIPNPLVPLKTPTTIDRKVQIKTKPNSKVIYWAASGKDEKQNYITAYGSYTNSGVVMSDSNGNAELGFAEGSGYHVPSGRNISRHVHYRVMYSDAMMGPIETVKY